MPQIVVHTSFVNSSNSDCQADDDSELFLLEFQGKFETAPNVSLYGNEIGKLDLSGDKPVYLVGNQKLTGKEVKLAKPLAILKKQSTSKAQGNIDVVAVIRKKILFDSRPVTIMK